MKKFADNVGKQLQKIKKAIIYVDQDYEEQGNPVNIKEMQAITDKVALQMPNLENIDYNFS